MIITFQKKFEKLNFITKNAKAGVIKILITIPLAAKTQLQLVIKPWRLSLGPWCRENDIKIQKDLKKIVKIANIFQKLWALNTVHDI